MGILYAWDIGSIGESTWSGGFNQSSGHQGAFLPYLAGFDEFPMTRT